MAQEKANTHATISAEGSRRWRATRAALWISLLYLVIALTWIAVSDRVVEGLVEAELRRLTWFQTAKGCFFVVATGILLYFMIRHYMRSIQHAEEELRIQGEAALAEHQEELEKRVEQRTQELSQANAALKKEIEERHAIGEQLRAAKLLAENANAAKSVFLANTSHEIRTPLTSILGYADLLQDPSLTPEQRERYVSIVQQNAAHLLRLIDDLLDLSRVEMGKVSVTLGDYPPGEIVQQAVDLLRPRAADKNLRLSLEVAPDVPRTVHTDGVRLRQILVNLLSNAIKFTPAGAVDVRVRTARGQDGNDIVRFEVSDTGIGMKAAELERIFEPFYQVEQGASRRFGGSGLGLAICRQLAAQVGGRLTVQSVPDKGSTFTVEVPVSGAQVDTIPPVPGTTLNTKNTPITGNILLADDNANIRWLVEEYLRRAGASVVSVGNGIEAVHAIEQSLAANGVSPVDLVLIDIHMPDMDGPQAMRKIRQAGYQGPIVALTAHSITDQKRWQDLGCDAIAPKPIDRKTFIPLLARLIEERQNAPSAESRH